MREGFLSVVSDGRVVFEGESITWSELVERVEGRTGFLVREHVPPRVHIRVVADMSEVQEKGNIDSREYVPIQEEPVEWMSVWGYFRGKRHGNEGHDLVCQV